MIRLHKADRVIFKLESVIIKDKQVFSKVRNREFNEVHSKTLSTRTHYIPIPGTHLIILAFSDWLFELDTINFLRNCHNFIQSILVQNIKTNKISLIELKTFAQNWVTHGNKMFLIGRIYVLCRWNQRNHTKKVFIAVEMILLLC